MFIFVVTESLGYHTRETENCQVVYIFTQLYVCVCLCSYASSFNIKTSESKLLVITVLENEKILRGLLSTLFYGIFKNIF